MANTKRADDKIRTWAAALEKNGGNIARTARYLDIPRQTFQSAVPALREFLKAKPPTVAVEFPDFPDDDIPANDIIDVLVRRFEKKRASFDAHTWFPIRLRENKPIGLLVVGDPHLDDSGCNWPLIRQHVDICKRTDGMYAINIGDATNSWGGRLIKKYADQDTSLKTARRLVEWYLLESGMRWLVWLYGNHEHMGDGGPLLAQMAKRYGTNKLAMHDWEARFSLNFPNGAQARIFAAHDFAGNSMWNPLHGPVKAAMFGNDIDALLCGHKHNWAMSQWELPEQDVSPLMVRVRGYKFMDDYARRIGKLEQKDGAAILVVVDPTARLQAGKVTGFVDVEQGADYLTWLRSRS